MPVKGKLTNNRQLLLRTSIANGKTGNLKFEASINIDNKAFFVMFHTVNRRVTYTLEDIVQDAIKTVLEDIAKDVNYLATMKCETRKKYKGKCVLEEGCDGEITEECETRCLIPLSKAGDLKHQNKKEKAI